MEASAKSKTLRVEARWGKTWRDTGKTPLRTTNQNDMTRKKKGEKQETHRDLLESLTKKKKANKRIRSTLEGEKKKGLFFGFVFVCVFFFVCPSHRKKTIRSCAMISTLVYVCALIPHTQRRAKRSTRKQKKKKRWDHPFHHSHHYTAKEKPTLSLSFVSKLSML